MPSLISFVMRADQRKWCAGSFGRSVAFSRKLGAEGFQHRPTSGLNLKLPDRDDPRPEIPTKAELNAIINGAEGRWRPTHAGRNLLRPPGF